MKDKNYNEGGIFSVFVEKKGTYHIKFVGGKEKKKKETYISFTQMIKRALKLFC